MKKVFTRAAAVLFIASAIVFVGCEMPTNTIEKELRNPRDVPWIEGSGPKNLTATSFAGIIYVGWDPEPYITGSYEVFRRSEKDGTVVHLESVAQPTTGSVSSPASMFVQDIASANANALVNGASYTYGVISSSNPAYAEDITGTEGSYTPSSTTIEALSWSNTVTAKIPPAGTKVTAPTDVKAEKITIPGSTNGEYILVTWTEPAWADGNSPVAAGYTAKLTVGGDTGLNLTSGDALSAASLDTSSGYAIFPFLGGTNSVQVWGEFATPDPNAGGAPDYWQYYLPSDPVKVSLTVETTALNTTTNLSVVGGNTTTANSVRLTWDKITTNFSANDDRYGTEAAYTLYRVERSSFGATVGDWKAIDTSGKTVDPASTPAVAKYLFTDTGLTAETDYAYLLVAKIGNAVTVPESDTETTIKENVVILADFSATTEAKATDIWSTLTLDESVNQFQIKFEAERGATYNVYARKFNGPNQETTDPATQQQYGVNGYGAYELIRAVTPNTFGTVNGVTFDGDGYVNFLWTPTAAQRQQYDFKVEGTKSGSKPKTIIQSNGGSHYSLKSAIGSPVPSVVGKASDNRDYYEVSLPSGATNGLQAGESIEIWGTKTTTDLITGVVTTADASVRLFTFTPGAAFTTTLPPFTPSGSSFYFDVGGTATTEVTIDDIDIVIVAK